MSVSLEEWGMLGVIGCGLMGSVILEGMLEKKIVSPEDILIFDKDPARTGFLHDKWKLRVASDVKDLCREASQILFAVKPQNIAELIEDIKGSACPAAYNFHCCRY